MNTDRRDRQTLVCTLKTDVHWTVDVPIIGIVVGMSYHRYAGFELYGPFYGPQWRELVKKIVPLFLLLIISVLAAPLPLVHADDAIHKVAIHVDSNDPKLINMALNNVANLRKYYDSVGEKVEIEVVAYGPGLHMLRADTSPVIDRISVMALEIDNLKFSACGNTHSAMSKKAGKEIVLVDEASMVPSGVVQLITLQEQGYSYIRP